MKLLDSALFKLALQGTITLESAKVLKAIHENRACSLDALAIETGVPQDELKYHMDGLLQRGAIEQIGCFYFSPDLAGSISKLIDGSLLVAKEPVRIRV